MKKFLSNVLVDCDLTVNGTTSLGAATGVTVSTSDDSTKLATTAWVKSLGFVSTNTTYDLSVPSGTTNIRLTSSEGATDNILISAAGASTVSRVSDSEIRITSTDSVDYVNGVSLSGNILNFTGIGNAFAGSVDLSSIVADFDLTEVQTVYATVRNASGAVIPKGTPLAVLPGQTSGNISDVTPADAADPALMPAVYIANEDIAVGVDGQAIIYGRISGIDTSAFDSGTTVYVAPGGGWTSTKPVHPNLIQNLGVITKSHASNGGGEVMGAGRSNDLPNLTAGKIWVGTSTYPTESTTVHVDEANGRVGIGITSPAYKLEVIGTTASDAISSNIGFNVKTVTPPDTTNTTVTLVSGTELTVGKVYYSITYYNALGQTSRGSYKTIDITSGNQRVQLSNIPISSDPSVIGRKIYRSKVGESSSYGALVATIADNTTTSHLDTLPETDSAFSGHVFSRSIYYLSNTTANWISTNDVRSLIVDPNLTTLGVDAGSSITRAGSSTLIGYQAGRNITYGNGNTLVGSRAGLLISTGAQNTLIGDSSGSAITTGSYNIALGPQTLHNATGSHNIAMGYYTARSLSGNRNILLGGYIGDSAVSFNESVIIGVSASATTGVNGQVNINNLIFGNKNSQVVGIGTSNPSATLHIATSTTGGAASAIIQDSGRADTETLNYIALTDSNSSTQAKIGYLSTLNGELSFSNLIGGTTVSSTAQTILSASTNILLSTDGTTRIKITNTGNVGIGTTSPTERLHVSGNLRVTGAYYDSNNSAGTSGQVLSSTATGTDWVSLSEIQGVDGSGSASYLPVWTDSDTIGASRILQNNSGYHIVGDSSANYTRLLIKPPATKSLSLLEFAFANDENNASTVIYGRGDTSYPTINSTSRGTGTTQAINFAIDNSEKMRISTNGNIGIGTTSPLAPLHISDTSSSNLLVKLRVQNDLNQAEFGTQSGYARILSGGSLLYAGSNNATYFYYAGSTLMSLASNSVGIGTTAPSSKLHIEDGTPFLTLRGTDASYSNAGIQLISGHATNARALGVFHYVENSDVEWFAGLPYNSNDQYVINRNTGFTVPSSQSSPPGIGASQGRLLTINAAGNVGIGTDNPSYKLQVNGTARFGDGSPYLKVTSSSVEVEGTYLFAAYQGGTSFYAYDSVFRGLIKSDGSGGNVLKLGDTQERMRIVNGYVGIGTTSPSTDLEIGDGLGTRNVRIYAQTSIFKANTSGTGEAAIYLADNDREWRIQKKNNGNNLTIRDNTQGSDVMTFEAVTGNVGIGTSTPAGQLEVNDNIYIRETNGNPFLALTNRSAGDVSTPFYLQYDSTFGTIYSANPLRFYAGGDRAIDILANGNVGIGTTSPTQKLTVQGSISLSGDLYLEDNHQIRWGGQLGIAKDTYGPMSIYGGVSPTVGGIDFYYWSAGAYVQGLKLDNNGKVGIGTTSPSEKLHVAGKLKVEGTHSITTSAEAAIANPVPVVLESIPTATQYGAFLDYVIHTTDRGSHRAGTLTVTWNATEVVYSETATIDIGDTVPALLAAVINGSNVDITYEAPDPTFEIKYTLRVL